MNRATLDSMITSINSILAGSLFRCIECEWEGKTRIFRVFIDHPEGMNIDRCVVVNALLSDAVFIDESVSGQYTLEVSSPGIDRPLRFIEDFQANIGKTVEVVLAVQADGRKKAKGVLSEVDASGLVQMSLDHIFKTWTFPLSDLKKARLIW